MITAHLPLIEKKEIAKDTYAFIFPKPKAFSYQAGQYLSLSIEEPAIAAPKGTMRELSLASAPYENTVELALRFRDSEAKRGFLMLNPGDKAYIQGPFGNFHIQQGTEPAVFLAGGIGVVPFVSLIKQSLYDNTTRDFSVFFSNRKLVDIPYLAELTSLANNSKQLQVISTLTNEEKPGHASGYISHELIARHLPDYKNASYYLSGPQRFVGGMWDILEAMAIPDTVIHGEEFTGYGD